MPHTPPAADHAVEDLTALDEADLNTLIDSIDADLAKVQRGLELLTEQAESLADRSTELRHALFRRSLARRTPAELWHDPALFAQLVRAEAAFRYSDRGPRDFIIAAIRQLAPGCFAEFETYAQPDDEGNFSSDLAPQLTLTQDQPIDTVAAAVLTMLPLLSRNGHMCLRVQHKVPHDPYIRWLRVWSAERAELSRASERVFCGTLRAALAHTARTAWFHPAPISEN